MESKIPEYDNPFSHVKEIARKHPKQWEDFNIHKFVSVWRQQLVCYL